MNAEEGGSLAEVSLRPNQGSTDEAALDFPFRVVVEDAPS